MGPLQVIDDFLLRPRFTLRPVTGVTSNCESQKSHSLFDRFMRHPVWPVTKKSYRIPQSMIISKIYRRGFPRRLAIFEIHVAVTSKSVFGVLGGHRKAARPGNARSSQPTAPLLSDSPRPYLGVGTDPKSNGCRIFENSVTTNCVLFTCNVLPVIRTQNRK